MTIHEALLPLGLPVCHPPYKGGASKYICYQNLGQIGEIYAESREAATAMSWIVELISPAYDAEFIRQAKAALQDAGYIVTIDGSVYNNDKSCCQVTLLAEIEGDDLG